MKNNCSGRSLPAQMVLGMLVIALGVLFLLDSLNVLNMSKGVSFWSSVLFVVGIVKLLDTRSPNGVMIGLACVGASVLMVLSNLGLLYLNWRMVWPALLILFGLTVILRAWSHRRSAGRVVDTTAPASQGAGGVNLSKGSDAAFASEGLASADKVKAVDDDAYIEATTILGSFQRRLTTPHFRGGELTAIMGACNLDLRDCSIDGEVTIHVFAAMGGIVIKCPVDWTVVLQGAPLMGGFEEKTARPPHGLKRLIVKGYAVMGAVEVRN
jgi:predicted membrane protein